jgi:hypothetical protein
MLSHRINAWPRWFGGWICLALANAAIADGLANTDVTVERNGDVFKIESVSRIGASTQVAWGVLTDYEGYVDFVPGLTVSRRLAGLPLRVEERGEFGLLFFRKTVFATLEVEESPPSDIRFRSLEGNLRRLETSVQIRRDGDEIVLTYLSVIEPDFWVPPLIGTTLVRAAIRKKLGAVADEIQRRAQIGSDQ